MLSLVLTVHIVVCVLLVITVLMQSGKGAEAGAMMGSAGSSQSIFTSSSKGNILTKTTTILAIIFFATSIALTIIKSKNNQSSVFDGEAPTIDLSTQEEPAVDPTTAPATTTTPKSDSTKDKP